MLFELLDSNNRVKMSTSFVECLPDSETIMVMSLSGYKFRIDGSILSKTKMIEYLNTVSIKPSTSDKAAALKSKQLFNL